MGFGAIFILNIFSHLYFGSFLSEMITYFLDNFNYIIIKINYHNYEIHFKNKFKFVIIQFVIEQ